MRTHSSLAVASLMVLIGVSRSVAVDSPPQNPNQPTASDALAKGSGMQKTDVKPTTTASGLQYIDFKVGEGAVPQPGETAIVHYTGWLDDGTKFDSSRDHGKPFGFKVGMGQVIKGWDEGVSTMKVGGTRRLIVPPELGYGTRGAGKIIPPNARLTFDVELLQIRK